MAIINTQDNKNPGEIINKDHDAIVAFLKATEFQSSGGWGKPVPNMPGWEYYQAGNCVSAHYMDDSAKEDDFSVPVIARWDNGRITSRSFIRWAIGKCGWCGEPDTYAQYGYCGYCGGS